MDSIPPGSSVHGISQAGMLEWVSISFSRGYSQPGIGLKSPALAGGFFSAESLGQGEVLFLKLYNNSMNFNIFDIF